MPRWLIVLIVFLSATLWWATHRGAAPLAASDGGRDASDLCGLLMVPRTLDQVVQSNQSTSPIRTGKATLVPLAGISIVARVLGREDYSFAPESLLAT